MKAIHGGLFGVMAGVFLLSGCFGQQTIRSKAIAPTQAEAQQLAQGQLDEQAKGHRAVSEAQFDTTVQPQPGGGQVYVVKGKATVSD